MELTPVFSTPIIQKRRKVGFSSTIVQDRAGCQLITKQRCNHTNKRILNRLDRKISQSKNIKTFEDDGMTYNETFIDSAYSTFKSQNQGLSQVHNNTNLSWGRGEKDSDKIIESIDRSFRSKGFDASLICFQSLLLLLSSNDSTTATKISLRLLFCSKDDIFLNIKGVIYEGLMIKTSSMLSSPDPVAWLSHEKTLFCLAIIAQAFRNIEKSMTEKDKPSISKFIERDGPFLRCSLSAQLSLGHKQEQYHQISECLIFLLTHSDN